MLFPLFKQLIGYNTDYSFFFLFPKTTYMPQICTPYAHICILKNLIVNKNYVSSPQKSSITLIFMNKKISHLYTVKIVGQQTLIDTCKGARFLQSKTFSNFMKLLLR